MRGFLAVFFMLVQSVSFAAGCYQSSVVKPSPFMGNDGEVFQLADGSLWEVKYEYEYLYEYNPSVLICPESSKLIIDEKQLGVEIVSPAPERNNKKAPVSGGIKYIPSVNKPAQSRSSCESGHWIESVSNNGGIVKLEDGSVWEVDSIDTIDTALWLPVSDIVACDNKLINTDDNETVGAARIK